MPVIRVRSPRRAAAGFSLIEVMVTLLVVSIGMLGLAKLQAAAVSEASLSRVRSLMTYQAESLASLMRGNRAFWATTAGSFSVASSGTPTYPNGGSTDGPTCRLPAGGSTASCSTADLAWADLTYWKAGFINQFQGATVSVACVGPGTPATTCTAGGAAPTAYDITLSWSEKSVAINTSTLQTDADRAAVKPVTLVLHVQP